RHENVRFEEDIMVRNQRSTLKRFYIGVGMMLAAAGCGGVGDELPDEPVEAAASALTTMPLPVAYWSFDRCDAGVVLNDRGTGLNAALYNGASCGAGRYGSAGTFDGVDDRAEIADAAALHFSGAMTVSAWVKPTST